MPRRVILVTRQTTRLHPRTLQVALKLVVKAAPLGLRSQTTLSRIGFMAGLNSIPARISYGRRGTSGALEHNSLTCKVILTLSSWTFDGQDFLSSGRQNSATRRLIFLQHCVGMDRKYGFLSRMLTRAGCHLYLDGFGHWLFATADAPCRPGQ